MLGSDAPVSWSQEADRLVIDLPAKVGDHAYVIKIVR
jgi:hypothetical protein